MSIKRTVNPTALALSVPDAKAHLVVDHDDDDHLIRSYIEAATEQLESVGGIAFTTQTWVETLPELPGEKLHLSMGPVSSVETVKYYASDVLTTLASSEYRVIDKGGNRSMVVPVTAWPSVDVRDDAVEVTYKCGFGDSESAVPHMVKHSIRLCLTRMYEMRMPTVIGASAVEVPQFYNALVDSWRNYNIEAR